MDMAVVEGSWHGFVNGKTLTAERAINCSQISDM